MEYFSNRDKDVFIVNLPKMVDRGALLSRYSRTNENDIRKLWDKEFSRDETRGEHFYELIFLEYGDESISELVTAQIGIQNVSNILSKTIEEGRIGLSYLEKSSRYVSYGDKVNGRYLFALPEKIGIPESLHDDYLEFCNDSFDEYNKMKENLILKLKELYTLENTDFKFPDGRKITLGSDTEMDRVLIKSYETAIKSRALDEARSMLPSSTLTNIGISGNARAFAHLLERLKSYGTQESLWLYDELLRELKEVFPKLIDTVESNYGTAGIEYLRKLKSFLPKDIEFSKNVKEKVMLMKWIEDEEASSFILSSYYFERVGGSFDTILEKIRKIPNEEKRKLINEISALRNNRRHKPDRSLEHVYYTFQINLNYGAFRELQRHRLLSIQRKLLSTEYGYDIPPTIAKDDSMMGSFKRVMEDADSLFRKVKKYDAKIAQYVVPFAYRYPIIFTANLREIVYLVELRSTPQAHVDLREMSWDITKKIIDVNPSVAPFFKFVNNEKEELGRLSAEVRKESKKSSISGKK